MKADLLREQIQKARAATVEPFGVNIPLVRGDAEDLVRVTLEEGVGIVFTSSGTPAKFTGRLKDAGCTVVHLVASVRHAMKAVDAGCDAVVAEGFEAGGHNGVDEITTLALVPQVVDAVSVPVIAAGGIADGRGMAAAFALGAEGIQMGTRFAVTLESSAHERYKQALIEAKDTDTVFTLKKLGPVRLVKNPFAVKALEAERNGATREELESLLGRKREMLGIFEGNLEEGAIEAGQSSGLVKDLVSAAEVVHRTMRRYYEIKEALP